MQSANDSGAGKFMVAFAQNFKRHGRVDIPKWSDAAKIGKHRDLSPTDPDWLYKRTALMVRSSTPCVDWCGRFRKVYAGFQRGGTCTTTLSKGLGRIASHICQQLE